MATRDFQNGPATLSKSSHTPPSKWSQESARMAQKSKNNIDPTKERRGAPQRKEGVKAGVQEGVTEGVKDGVEGGVQQELSIT